MIRNIARIYFPVIAVLLLQLSACDRDNGTVAAVVETHQPLSPEVTARDTLIDIPEIEAGNKQYIFDINGHTLEELKSLLNRADEINVSQREDFAGLDIVLILHGPDIKLFTYTNYERYKDLIDLAARLDAFGVIDMKICEKSMSELGITINDFPPFIEPVPYARQTMTELTNSGYLKL